MMSSSLIVDYAPRGGISVEGERENMGWKQALIDRPATAIELRRIWISVDYQRSCASLACFSPDPVEEGSSHTQSVAIRFDEQLI